MQTYVILRCVGSMHWNESFELNMMCSGKRKKLVNSKEAEEGK